MTYEQKLRENKRLLERFVAFLSECTTYDERLKLSSEIGRLNDQNKQIEKMEYQETKKDMNDSILEVNAIFPTLDEQLEDKHEKTKFKKNKLVKKESSSKNLKNSNPVKPLSTYKKPELV